MDNNKKKGFFSRLSKPKKALYIFVVVIVTLLIVAGISITVVLKKGEASLRSIDNPRIDKMALEEAKSVYYNGKNYVYNDDLINILLIGIDSRLTVSQRRESNKTVNLGMADAFILLTIDPKQKQVSATAINRYSMTEQEMALSSDNVAWKTYTGQLGLQYSWGKGLEDSCELQEKALSKMLHNIPINGYASLGLPAIRNLNHVVGGVELVALDNIPGKGNFDEDEAEYGIGDSLENVKGKTIRLTDNQAFAYLKYRNVYDFGSADVRLERQKQYLKILVNEIKEKTKKDITFPWKVWEALSDYLVTDIDSFEIAYLASTLIGYKIDLEKMDHIPGTLQVGGDGVEEYYIDEEALQEMLINKFYKVAE